MTWQTVKTVLWSAAGGAVVWWIVLSAGFGWLSAGGAEKQAGVRAASEPSGVFSSCCRRMWAPGRI
jgi:hypothetical protein